MPVSYTHLPSLPSTASCWLCWWAPCCSWPVSYTHLAEIKEAYRNGQPAVLKIVINGISETLFLVKKNGGYAATKTLPSLTTV